MCGYTRVVGVCGGPLGWRASSSESSHACMVGWEMIGPLGYTRSGGVWIGFHVRMPSASSGAKCFTVGLPRSTLDTFTHTFSPVEGLCEILWTAHATIYCGRGSPDGSGGFLSHPTRLGSGYV